MSAVSITYAILITFIIALLWLQVCNLRTLKQRVKVIDVVFTRQFCSEKFAAFSNVSYDKHMFELFQFRDPMPLYGDKINRQLSGLSA